MKSSITDLNFFVQMFAAKHHNPLIIIHIPIPLFLIEAADLPHFLCPFLWVANWKFLMQHIMAVNDRIFKMLLISMQVLFVIQLAETNHRI